MNRIEMLIFLLGLFVLGMGVLWGVRRTFHVHWASRPRSAVSHQSALCFDTRRIHWVWRSGRGLWRVFPSRGRQGPRKRASKRGTESQTSDFRHRIK